MNETAAHLVDHVFPHAVPVRQWVLSVPIPLRYLLAYNRELCTEVLTIFIRAVFGHLRRKAKRTLGLRSVQQAHPGSVTMIQRFNSAMALHLHYHVLAMDGVFGQRDHEQPVFHALEEPSDAEIAQVAWTTCQQTLALLRKRGLWIDMDPADDQLTLDEPMLAQCYAASIQGTLTLGPQTGQRVVRFYGAEASERKDVQHTPTQAPGYGFNVHAKVRIPGDDKAKLERLCRYITRPPLSGERLSRLADGRVQVRLKRPWSDGTTAMIYDPLDFLTKLAALVPRPRSNQIRFHGIFAPHAKLRNAVVPTPAEENQDRSACTNHGHAIDKNDDEAAKRRRYGWAKLMARVFSIDVLECPVDHISCPPQPAPDDCVHYAAPQHPQDPRIGWSTRRLAEASSTQADRARALGRIAA